MRPALQGRAVAGAEELSSTPDVSVLSRTPSVTSAAELKVVPGRNGRKVEKGAITARVAVCEVGPLLVPLDIQQLLFHAVVEPRAAEDELPHPVHEGLLADEREPLPVTDEVFAEPASWLLDPRLRGELDKVRDLGRVKLFSVDESEPYSCGVDALLEVNGIEGKAVTEELDDEVVARDVVRFRHLFEG
jgi:hypothetical protein